MFYALCFLFPPIFSFHERPYMIAAVFGVEQCIKTGRSFCLHGSLGINTRYPITVLNIFTIIEITAS